MNENSSIFVAKYAAFTQRKSIADVALTQLYTNLKSNGSERRADFSALFNSFG
jgi:hypothetical protein